MPVQNPTPDKLVSFNFPHGLGDSALFAHAVPLWTARGYKVQVQVTPDKACMFAAAGAELVESAAHHNPYLHPPGPGMPKLDDGFSGNKVAWNVTQHPLPWIGSYADLWPELVATRLRLNPPDDAARRDIDAFLKTVPGPLVLVHTQGNSSPESKSINDLEVPLYRELLHRTDATLLLLDWDNRVARLDSYRVRHVQDEFRTLSLPELAYLMDKSALVIGVDSGVLHFTRFTDVPALGVWTHHHPAHFALPRDKTAHLCTARHGSWNRYRRHSFNVIEVGTVLKAEDIAEQARRVLAGRVGRDLVLDHLLDKVHQIGDQYQDRDRTFRLLLDHLKTTDHPHVIETGCMRAEEDFTAGMSTYLLGMFLDKHGGHLDSVDLDPNNCHFARKWTAPFGDAVTVHTQDSVTFLTSYTGPKLAAVYLDSLDVGQVGYAEHCLKEAQAAVKLLDDGGLVLIDDSPRSRGRWTGKGTTAIPWLMANNFDMVYSGYQCLLRKA